MTLGSEKAAKLNGDWVEADTFNEAVAKFADIHPHKGLFVWGAHGWTFTGLRLYDNESAARASFG